jgi:starch phosphorylase
MIQISKKYGGIQIIYSGKAHPRDGEGKDIIRRIFSKIKELKGSIEILYSRL